MTRPRRIALPFDAAGIDAGLLRAATQLAARLRVPVAALFVVDGDLAAAARGGTPRLTRWGAAAPLDPEGLARELAALRRRVEGDLDRIARAQGAAWTLRELPAGLADLMNELSADDLVMIRGDRLSRPRADIWRALVEGASPLLLWSAGRGIERPLVVSGGARLDQALDLVRLVAERISGDLTVLTVDPPESAETLTDLARRCAEAQHCSVRVDFVEGVSFARLQIAAQLTARDFLVIDAQALDVGVIEAALEAADLTLLLLR